MRYAIEFQNTTGEWVLFDTVDFCMLPNRYKTEEEAYLKASNHAEFDKKRVLGSRPKYYTCHCDISME